MTSIRVKPNQTPVTENTSTMATIKDTQREITELYQELSYDDLQGVLNNWLNADSDVKEEEVNPNPTVTNEQVKQAATNTSDVSAAFDELFNN